MSSSTELVSYRDTGKTKGSVFVEAPSTWRSPQRLPERGERSMQVLQAQGSAGADVLRQGWV